MVFCNTMNDIACVVNYLMMKLEKHAYSPKELCEQPNYQDLLFKFLATLQEQNCVVFPRRGESTGCSGLFCPKYGCKLSRHSVHSDCLLMEFWSL